MPNIISNLNVKSIFRRISVLFIYLLNVEVTVVGTALGEIKKAFPDADPVLISLVYTFPILIMTIINFFVLPSLSKRHDKKKLVMIGLVFYVIGGVGGAFITASIYHIIAMRTLVGIGAGISAPLCGAIINELYDGMEKTNMLGWANAVDSIVGIGLTMLAGVLCAIRWEYTFFVYGFFIIVLLMVATSLPSLPAPVVLADSSVTKKIKLNYTRNQKVKLFLVCFYGMIFLICIQTLMIKFAIFVSDEKIGNPVVIATGMSILMSGIIISSIMFGSVERIFRRKTIMLPPLLVAFGAFVLFKATGPYITYLGMLTTGLGAGLTLPFLQTKALAIGTKENGAFANSMVIGIVNGGQFLSSFVEKAVGIFIEPTARHLMGFVTISFVIITIISALYMIIDPLKGMNASPENVAAANKPY